MKSTILSIAVFAFILLIGADAQTTAQQKPFVEEVREALNELPPRTTLSNAGNAVKQFVDTPIALRPFATVAILVTKEIDYGGMGANFNVVWAASAAVSAPAAEAIMMGKLGTNRYSFVSPGRPIDMVENQ